MLKVTCNSGGPLNLDEFLSGIPLPILTDITEEVDSTPVTLDQLLGLQRLHKTRTGISDQKHLEEFILYLDNSNDPEIEYLTHAGGYFGLALASPTLRHVKMERSNMVQGVEDIDKKCLTNVWRL